MLCGALSVTLPTAWLPPTTLAGETETLCSNGGGGAARTVSTSLKLYRPSLSVTVTSVSDAVGLVSKNAWKPSRFSDAGASIVFGGTMEGWLLVSCSVGPPALDRPLRSTCPNVWSPPVMGFRPEMNQSPRVGRATAGAGFCSV